MSSPRGPRRSVPESTRVVLREITAAAHNSPPMQSPCFQSGNDSSLQKTSEYEVKVRFAREFADVGSIGYNTVPESLSSSSSFQSLSSTRSTKSSSGICSDSVPQSIDQISDTSYLNSSIPGVDDLIRGCSKIKLGSENTHEISHDQTFISATDESIPDFTESLGSNDSLLADPCNVTQAIETSSCSVNNRTQDLPDRPVVVIPLTQTEEPSEKSISPSGNDDLTASSQTCSFDVVEELPLPSHSTEGSNLNTTTCLSPDKVNPDAPTIEDQQIIVEDIQTQVVVDDYQDQVVVEDFQAQVEVEDFQAQVEVEDFQAQAVVEDFQDQTESIALNIVPYSVTDSVSSVSAFAEYTEDLSLPSISILPSLQLTDSSRLCGNETRVNDSTISVTEISKNVLNSFAQETDDKSSNPLVTFSPDFCDAAISRESCTNLLLLSETSSAISRSERVEERLEANAPAETEDDINIQVKVEAVLENTDATESLTETEDEKGEQSSEEKLGRTSIVKDELLKQETAPEEEHYKDFKPQRQSTTLVLPNIEQTNLEELKSSAEEVANDIFKSTIDFPEESDCYTTATSNIFQDPTSFDFLINHGNSRIRNRLRADSLYVKFDPLVGDTSNMLLQENTDPINEEEQNGKTESPPPSIVTPKRNPAIAAIDRLLFYSPITTGMTPKMEEPKEKNEQAADEPKSETPFINDINMSKELELVRATVLQLEEELEKQKKEHKAELERQKNSFQEKINQLQAQLAQEVKSKSEITVVVEEYEKSISRLLTEKGRDQEELQATNVHLSNTEAAFNDVHQKYEKMKSVVSVYKNNEIVLRESIQENMQTIKCLHTRYDNLKAHALSQLEKANSDLENIRKQHEDEIVTLHALVRKAELKSNSLSELVEQKTKENKELVQILDEVIARVGHPTAE
ncbi:transforming acidic coiled-coil protein isoform X2 [Lasioglossum baleicum]|uniref:transforming acidic coiled-coil protein isoform X2 n=1 Tax=Lasioglossum baleicum TaxID=434251 RepID=UPI003FCD918D